MGGIPILRTVPTQVEIYWSGDMPLNHTVLASLFIERLRGNIQATGPDERAELWIDADLCEHSGVIERRQHTLPLAPVALDIPDGTVLKGEAQRLAAQKLD